MEKLSTAHKEFIDLFYEDLSNEPIDGCDTKINLHILKIENNRFCYSELVDNLFDNIVTYSLSRKELKLLKEKHGTAYTRAVQKLRKYEENEGELGEILLYCFLECHLNAPKVFTKLELKTSSNEYVKGSDGVHILKIDEKNYQLVFGESKLRDKLTRALYDSFKSIKDFIDRPDNNINDEIHLLNTNLEKEAADDELYDFLKKIIVPKASDEEVFKDNAFGILVGFDIEIDDDIKKLENREFREKIREKIKSEVLSRKDYIKNKINELGLRGYSFYIYAIPFTDLAETRKKAIKHLKGASNDF